MADNGCGIGSRFSAHVAFGRVALLFSLLLQGSAARGRARTQVGIPIQPEPLLDVVAQVISLNSNGDFEGQFDTLVDAIVSVPGLADTLTENTVTVFAPTDDAFFKDGLCPTAEAGTDGCVDVATVPDAILQNILTYHVADGSLVASDILGETVETLQGGSFSVTGAGVIRDEVGDEANILSTDIICSNGVVHLIEDVLFPETTPVTPRPHPTLAVSNPGTVPTDSRDIVVRLTALNREGQFHGQFDALLDAVSVVPGLVDTLSTDTLTLFAPTDVAFQLINLCAKAEVKDNCADITSGDESFLSSVLTYHVAPGAQLIQDILGETVFTVQETTFDVTDDGYIIDASGSIKANIVAADILARNGVIDVIDRVLTPPEFTHVPTEAPPTAITTCPATSADFLELNGASGCEIEGDCTYDCFCCNPDDVSDTCDASGCTFTTFGSCSDVGTFLVAQAGVPQCQTPSPVAPSTPRPTGIDSCPATGSEFIELIGTDGCEIEGDCTYDCFCCDQANVSDTCDAEGCTFTTFGSCAADGTFHVAQVAVEPCPTVGPPPVVTPPPTAPPTSPPTKAPTPPPAPETCNTDCEAAFDAAPASLLYGQTQQEIRDKWVRLEASLVCDNNCALDVRDDYDKIKFCYVYGVAEKCNLCWTRTGAAKYMAARSYLTCDDLLMCEGEWCDPDKVKYYIQSDVIQSEAADGGPTADVVSSSSAFTSTGLIGVGVAAAVVAVVVGGTVAYKRQAREKVSVFGQGTAARGQLGSAFDVDPDDW